MSASHADMAVSLARGEVNGVAKLLATVLTEKLEEAPWKRDALAGMGRKVVCVDLTDRGERAYVETAGSGVAIRTVTDAHPDVTIRLTSKLLPKVLMIPEGPGRLPGLWIGKGKDVTRALLRRELVVKGLVVHLGVVVRVLQTLSVPARKKKES